MNSADNYYQLCREQLLNLNNLYLVTYNNNLQMHSNFLTLLSNNNNLNRNIFNSTQNRENNLFPLLNRNQTNTFPRNQPFRQPPPVPPPPPTPPTPPPPPPPPIQQTGRRDYNFSNIFENTPRTHFERRRPFSRRRYDWNIDHINSRSSRSARNTRRQPFAFTFPNPTQNILNRSLYDPIPNNPLSTTDFLRETTHDTWNNIRTLLNLPENTRCAITQEQFNNNDIVSRIYHCGHVFNRDALVRWFERDSRCPICRYNLSRNTFYNTRQSTTSQTTSNSNENIQTNTATSSLNNDISRNTVDLSNNRSPLTWRTPLISPVNTSSLFDSLANEIEQNITNTLLDNSENIMNLSSQVANSLFDSFSNNTNFSDILTTEFTFNIPTESNLTTGVNAFNNFMAGTCENNNNSETLEEKTEENVNETEETLNEEKTEENVNEEKTEENVNEEKTEEYADEMD